jgi:hypothetical protein
MESNDQGENGNDTSLVQDEVREQQKGPAVMKLEVQL